MCFCCPTSVSEWGVLGRGRCSEQVIFIFNVERSNVWLCEGQLSFFFWPTHICCSAIRKSWGSKVTRKKKLLNAKFHHCCKLTVNSRALDHIWWNSLCFKNKICEHHHLVSLLIFLHTAAHIQKKKCIYETCQQHAKFSINCNFEGAGDATAAGEGWDNDSGRKNLGSVQENLPTYSKQQRAYVLFVFCWIFMLVLGISPTPSLICLAHPILTALTILVKHLSLFRS